MTDFLAPEPCADLHIHTHFSDSTSPPEEVVEQALNQQLKCIAITDHDTLDGVGPTQTCALKYDLEVISGIELSSKIEGKDIHVLGYFVDAQNTGLRDKLTEIQGARLIRIKQMIQKLNGLNIKGIEYEEVLSLTESNAVGRPHLAQVLVNKGHVGSIKEAFNKYLADNAPAYVGKLTISPFEAIDLIKKAGGLAVLAHPMLNQKDEIIPSMVEAGLDGIEVYYPPCAEHVTTFYLEIAQKHSLLVTGGSDAHGQAKKHTWVGKVKVPYELVDQMKQRIEMHA